MGSSVGNQEPWMPFEPTKDCSQGFCSIYCPQWCYIIFPPPPPFFFSDDQSSSEKTFSPLVITIIAVLASAFLLVSYYTIISKYCVSFDTLRRRFHRHHRHVGPEGNIIEEDHLPGASSRRYETWYNSPSNGLDEALINKITVCKYKRDDGLIDSTDCSVCLGEFREDESLRLLPKCSHAFHLHCIDTWLKSHSNCPLCRASIIIISVNPMPSLQLLPAPPDQPLPPESSNVELAVIVANEESNPREEEEENHDESNNDVAQEDDHKIDHVVKEDETVLQVIPRSFSMDSSSSASSSSSSHRGRVSIADVLRLSIDDDEHQVFAVARENNKGSISNRSRGLHCVMSSPVQMKRSFSSGRFCFTRLARDQKTSLLPL